MWLPHPGGQLSARQVFPVTPWALLLSFILGMRSWKQGCPGCPSLTVSAPWSGDSNPRPELVPQCHAPHRQSALRGPPGRVSRNDLVSPPPPGPREELYFWGAASGFNIHPLPQMFPNVPSEVGHLQGQNRNPASLQGGDCSAWVPGLFLGSNLPTDCH